MKKVFSVLLISLLIGFIGCSDSKEDEIELIPPPTEEGKEKDNRPEKGIIGKASSIGTLKVVRFRFSHNQLGEGEVWKREGSHEYTFNNIDVHLNRTVGNLTGNKSYPKSEKWTLECEFENRECFFLIYETNIKDNFYQGLDKPSRIGYHMSQTPASANTNSSINNNILLDNNTLLINADFSTDKVYNNGGIRYYYRVSGNIKVVFEIEKQLGIK